MCNSGRKNREKRHKKEFFLFFEKISFKTLDFSGKAWYYIQALNKSVMRQ